MTELEQIEQIKAKTERLKESNRQRDNLAFSALGSFLGLVEIQQQSYRRSPEDFLARCIEVKDDYKKKHGELLATELKRQKG